jgi:hypothetical protein
MVALPHGRRPAAIRVAAKVPRAKEEWVALQPALGDVSCDLRDVETAKLTEGWLELTAGRFAMLDMLIPPAVGRRCTGTTSRSASGEGRQ